MFISKANVKFHPNDVEVSYHKTISYSDEVLNMLGQKIWNHCPSNIQFKTFFIKVDECINPNLGGLFRGSFWWGWWSKIKLVRAMLETLNLARKYTLISSFRKYIFQYQGTANFTDVSFFRQKISVFWLK